MFLWIRRLGGALVRPVIRRLAPLIFIEIRAARHRYHALRAQDILRFTQSPTSRVKVLGKFEVNDPRSLALGDGVVIGERVRINAVGGVVIGSNTRLGNDVLINSVEPNPGGWPQAWPKPVLIGCRAYIGDRACILPGVRIGAGAVIAPGTVVGKDVPDGAIVKPAESWIAGQRRGLHDSEAPGTLARRVGENMFFVVGHGRSGTMSIAQVLSKHPRIVCCHEPRPQMIRLSTELAHGLRTAGEAESELRALYLEGGTMPADKLYGEADQKYWNLIVLLQRLLPAARFVWLLRDGRDVVASMCVEDWYPTDRRGDPVHQDLSERWIFYRLQGDRCGAFSPAEWAALSTFEKNCWHWSFVNREIEKQWSGLPAERRFQVRLDELSAKMPELLAFLGVETLPLRVERHNRTAQAVRRWQQWTSEERQAFEKWCGAEMDRWFPGWRSGWGV